MTAPPVAVSAEPLQPVSTQEVRQTFNFNPDWLFIRDDVPDAAADAADTVSWQRVSCPHTWNDVDSFDDFCRGGHQGETNLWTGVTWYRKEFSLPEIHRGRKVFIEFEGVRQIADVYLNGCHLGRDQTGFIPFGFDLTPHLRFGKRNVLAVRVDNSFDQQYAGDVPWNHPNWHPPHGGIYRNVRLHVTDPLHVTLPLHAHLQTEGTYAWVETLSAKEATVGVTAEIANEQSMEEVVTVEFSLVDREGLAVGSSRVEVLIPAGKQPKVTSHFSVPRPQLWEPDHPYVYRLRTTLSVDGVLRDVAETAFGIRHFRFDRETGFWINGQPLKLHGWGQKPTHAWPGLGAALPDWLRDYTLRLMWEAGGNFLRWGHCAGSPAEVGFGDKYGFVTLMPGVDGERDCDGAAWATRAAAFRDLIIYFRNHPSICAWEGGNYNVSPTHSAELREVMEQWDPRGGRYFGFRMSVPGMLPSLDLELGTIGRTRALPTLPVVETEYDRVEAPRRLWDRYSPPDFGRAGAREQQNTYHMDSEQFATNAVHEWWSKFGSDPAHSGGANWVFSDGPHGGRQVTEVVRCSGEVDAARLPKEAFWAIQSIWREEPRIHLIGHWNYPEGTIKTVFAVAQADRAELLVNGQSRGYGKRSQNYLFTWEDIAFEPGEIEAVAYRGGEVLARQRKATAGPAIGLRLTPMTAPGGWRADGSDVVLVDFEVVDAQGRRCPTDQGRIDFEISGPARWCGGYNSGREGTTHERHLETECSINRVGIRSTLEAGLVTVVARRPGLVPATLQLESKPLELHNGMTRLAPAVLEFDQLPPRSLDTAALDNLSFAPRTRAPAEPPPEGGRCFSSFAYTGDGVGGDEVDATAGALAYSDDALSSLGPLPDSLQGTHLIRTANRDSGYWANDYIVAVAARDLELLVAHDPRIPKPAWLESFQTNGDSVMVRERELPLYAKRLSRGEVLRLSGAADQGRTVRSALNIILFCRPLGAADEPPSSPEMKRDQH